jgi:kexin
MSTHHRLIAAIVAAGFFLPGCSDDDDPKPSTFISYFRADPPIATTCKKSTLVWSAMNASSCTLDAVGEVPVMGSLEVAPTATTTYLLTCSGVGPNATAQTTVTLHIPPPAPTSPVATAQDGYVEIAWTAAPGATSYVAFRGTAPGVTPENWHIHPGGERIPGLQSGHKIGGLVNGTTYHFAIASADAMADGCETVPVSATPADGAGTNDTLFTDQWHLQNGTNPAEDANVIPVWTGTPNIRGEAIRVAVVDDGLEIAHPDLVANVATGQSRHLGSGSLDPGHDGFGHGTAVAGVIAGRDLNDIGVRGAAPRANLVGYNLLDAATLSAQVDAMTLAASRIHVSNNSWGPLDQTGRLAASDPLWRQAVLDGLANGRGGLGTIYLFAAGNGNATASPPNPYKDNSNYDGLANFRGVLAVGAVGHDGVQADYSESGANLWVSAHSLGNTGPAITTTDLTGIAGLNNGMGDLADTSYTQRFNGTSAATPLAAGVVALMLQARPDLSWRDVREVLAQSARKVHAADPGWADNAAGRHFNHKYGFGAVDAAAAVALAKTWTRITAPRVTHTTPVKPVGLAVPDANATGITDTISVSGSGISHIEHVEIVVTTSHNYSGDLEIVLTRTASGTRSVLAEEHLCLDNLCINYQGWTFASAAHLGEGADGNWTLTVKDLSATVAGTLTNWQLIFHGR